MAVGARLVAKRFLIWFWSGGGGGSVFAVNLACRLRLRFGGDSVALSLRADDPAVHRARAMGLDVHVVEGVSDRRRPIETIAALADNRRALAQHARDADVVIVPMNFASAAPLSVVLKQPLVYCAHDPEPHPGDYARTLQRATQAALVRRAKKVVALSTYGAHRLRALGVSTQKLVTLPLQSVFEPAPQQADTTARTRLLFTGRMLAYKGVEVLAAALDQLSARDDWRLTIAGDGPSLDEAATRRFALPQIEAVLRGWLADVDLEQLIAGADVLIFPYRSATQSGVLAHGLALGKPSVVTPVGALPEQIGDGAAGWVADSADANAVARALHAVLDNSNARADKAAAAQAIARDAWGRDSWGWLGDV
jgi:glycosyltransferase involved in cell wall biosynthesis